MPAREVEIAEAKRERFFSGDGCRSSWWPGVFLTGASVILFAGSAPGRMFPWLAWICMVPLFYLLRRCSRLGGIVFGGLFGWLMWLSSVWWLYAPLRDMLGMSSGVAGFITVTGCFLMGLPYAIAGGIIARWGRVPGILGATRDAAIFTLAITFFTPVFHGSLAHTQYSVPLALQVVELGGAPLLLFLILWVNGLIAEGIGFFGRNRLMFAKAIGTAVGLLTLVFGYGAVRLHQLDKDMATAPAEHWITVGAVQPNIPIVVSEERQPDPDAANNSFFTAVEQAQRMVANTPSLDLIAFPENPAPFVFNDDALRRQTLAKLIRETGKPVVLNADAIDLTTQSEGVPLRYNVALWMDAQRNLAGNYAKMKRIPLVEHIPAENMFPWLRKFFPKSQRVLAGEGPAVFEVKPGIRVIPLICYEGTFSAFTRSFVEKGGNIIVNLVNDSWFLRTPASEVHLALTIFRTVEYRLPLVRVTNSGIGMHVQPSGQIVAGSRTSLFTEDAKAFPLYVPPQRSLYARIGIGWMFLFLALIPFNKRRAVSQ